MTKWITHYNDDYYNPEWGDQPRFTITQNDKYSGWDTDHGAYGYGLPKELAQWICDQLNNSKEECPFKMYLGVWVKKEDEDV